MEKVIWVRSNAKAIGTKENDGLDAVNQYLEDGWKVKHIAACAVGDSLISGLYCYRERLRKGTGAVI